MRYLILLALLVSCASQAPKKKKDDIGPSGVPSWVYAPEKLCKKHEFCGVGSGTGLAMAKTNARVAIARIFETKVESVFTQSLSSDNKSDADLSLSEDVKEITEGALNGVEIRKTYPGKTEIFALGVLDKRKAARMYKDEISELDNKIKVYANDKSLRASMKLRRLLVKRRPLNSRYQVLTGRGIRPVVDYETVYRNIKEALKDVVVAIKTEGEAAEELGTSIKKVMTDNDYRLVDWEKGSLNYSHVVIGKITFEKQYMKVSGFEKYRFLLDIHAKNRKGQQAGAIKYEVAVTGRNYQQAYDRAQGSIHAFLFENLADLNIE